VNRVFPKGDKIQQFEKALAAHVQKYHKGDWAWRVSTIETGPDAGGYNIVEGPNAWGTLDSRGDISKEHQADWNMNVQPLLTDRASNAYAVFRPELSTVQMTDYSDKIYVQHIFHRPGYGYSNQMENLIKGTLQESYAKANGGEKAWKDFVEGYKQAVDHQWYELIFLKKDLSSK
jgi:hypothetical protein